MATPNPSIAGPNIPPPATAVAPAGPPVDPQIQTAPNPFDEAFASLDKLGQSEEPAAIAPVKEPPAETPAPEETETPEVPVVKTDPAKPPELPKTPDPARNKLPAKAKDLRTVYDETKEKLKEAERRISEYETKLKQPAEDPQRKILAEQLEAVNKRLAEHEETIKYQDYRKSQEFKEKFEAPFMQAYQNGRAKIARLKIAEQRDPETNDVVRPSRQATEADFDALMQISDDGAAAQAAFDLFGPNASTVMYHRERILEMNESLRSTEEQYRTKGAEREKGQMAEHAAFNEKRIALWKQVNDETREKYPQWFKPVDDDPDGNKLLDEGYRYVDLALSSQVAQLPLEKQVAIHADMRNRAAGFTRLAHRNNQLTAELAALKAELEQYKASEPGKPDVTESRQTQDSLDWESQLAKFAT